MTDDAPGADAARVADTARDVAARAFAHTVPARASTSACRDACDGSSVWKSKSRHFIACTRAGKPTYARYGDVHKLSALCAALCALYDASRDGLDGAHVGGSRADARVGGVRAIVAPGRAVVFHATEHMLYVATSSIEVERESTLHAQLRQFRRAMESLVTNAALEHALAKNSKFDVGRALEGRTHADVVLATAIRSMSWDTSYVFNTYRTFALAAPIRRSCTEAIRAALTFAAPFAGAMFSSDGRLGAYAKPRGNRPLTISANDMIVLMNHVRVMRDVAERCAEVNADDEDAVASSFERLCLPEFNANGFMHAYVAPLSRDTPGVIVCFLTASADAREQCEVARKTLVKKLNDNKSLAAVASASETTMDVSTLPPEAFGGFTDSRDALLHFVYNRPAREQHVSSTFSASLDVKDVKTLARAYAALYAAMTETDADAFNVPPTLVGAQRVRYETRERFNILSCVGGDFEIYLTLKPSTSVVVAVALCNRLCVYLRVAEPELFLSPTQ